MDVLASFGSSTLTIPFRLRGFPGEVVVYYTVNESPALWGFDLLHLPFDVNETIGFPVFLATTRYDGSGYRAVMGWSQVLTITPHDGTKPLFAIDHAPADGDKRSPAAFSYLPSLFDAPGPNPPRNNERWEAESYLLVCPDVARSRRVMPILGVRWGYDLVQRSLSILPLTPLDETDWRRVVPLYRSECPAWDIAEAFHQEDQTAFQP